MRRALSICALALAYAGGAQATDTTSLSAFDDIPFEFAAALLGDRITFEEYPETQEPGHLIDGVFTSKGTRIGEHFCGQSLTVTKPTTGAVFDALEGVPMAPLTVLPGAKGETLALAHHRGLGSMAAFALGPKGFPDIAARGEGALAVLFAKDQEAAGLRLHADYADPFGTRPAPGKVTITFYARTGTVLGVVEHEMDPGVVALAWRFTGTKVAGFTLTTMDPGGIAFDDILVLPLALSG